MEIREVLRYEIAKTAYEIYEKRGGCHGCDLDDWLEAEKIVMKGYDKKTETKAEVISKARKKSSGDTKPKTRKTSEKTSKAKATTKKRQP